MQCWFYLPCSLRTNSLHSAGLSVHVVPRSLRFTCLHAEWILDHGNWNGDPMFRTQRARIQVALPHSPRAHHGGDGRPPGHEYSPSTQLRLVPPETADLRYGHDGDGSVCRPGHGLHHCSLPHETLRHSHHALRERRNGVVHRSPRHHLLSSSPSHATQ